MSLYYARLNSRIATALIAMANRYLKKCRKYNRNRALIPVSSSAKRYPETAGPQAHRRVDWLDRPLSRQTLAEMKWRPLLAGPVARNANLFFPFLPTLCTK